MAVAKHIGFNARCRWQDGLLTGAAAAPEWRQCEGVSYQRWPAAAPYCAAHLGRALTLTLKGAADVNAGADGAAALTGAQAVALAERRQAGVAAAAWAGERPGAPIDVAQLAMVDADRALAREAELFEPEGEL